MYISDLEIKGFKSFADPTRIKFAEGLTCIVGPNGCGKTNVVDAIRWVLGEQKSSVLRSQSIHDVIFTGTSKRKQVNFAEVSLTIHNDRGILPVEYTDVVITRRVFRDGVSEFFINKNACRLKDITDLFIDTGMGADAYSVIELKMVESILSESKEERRRLIEEASGINKYKQQRRLSMRRLDATENDLSRVNDIILEVEKNVGSLRRQLAKYKRFDRVQNQLKEDEVALAGFQVNEIRKELDPIKQQMHQLSEGYGASGEQLGLEEKRVEEAKAQLALDESRLEDQQKLVNARNAEKVSIEQTLLIAEEKITNATSALDRIRVEKHALSEREESTNVLSRDLKNEREHLYPRIQKVQDAYEELKSTFNVAVEAYRAAKTTHDEKNQQHIDLLNQLSDLDHKKSYDEASLEQYDAQLIRLKEKQERLGKADETYQLELNLVKDDFSQSEALYKSLEKKISDLEKEFQSLQSVLNEKREILARKRGERVSIENQLSFYEELLESGEGYSSGVKVLISGDDKPEGILGTVADILNVEPRFERAVQAALGPLAEAVVTRDRKEALAAIDYLKEKGAGTARFLPLKRMSNIRKPEPPQVKGNGVIGPALDFISVEAAFESLAQVLLGDLYIVENDFQPDWDNFSGRTVSEEGTLFDAFGLIQGGMGNEAEDTIIGRRDRIDRLRKAYSSLVDEIEKYAGDIEQLHEKAGATEREIRSTRSARDNQRQILLEVERKNSRAQYGISSTKADLLAVENEIKDITEAVEKTRERISAFTPEIESLKHSKLDLENEIEAMEASLQTLLNQRDEASEAAQAGKLELVNLQNEARNLDTRLENINETQAEILSRREAQNEEQAVQESILKENRQIQADEKARLTAVKTELEREEETLKDIINQVQVKRQALNELELILREHHHKREDAAEKLRELSVKAANLEARQEHIKERIQEKYELTLSSKSFSEELDVEALEKRIKRSENFIEKLGPINMGVQDEFDAEQGRLNFLKEQQADLVDAKSSLIETISKLDRIARKQFRETFALIQEHFKVTFQMLFDGGHANLIMEDPDDVLESDIVIRATPRGKKTQNLKMLSAGEKALTAIALLFAIYQVKPSPYCVLDEVDAPLDDRNIRKYTKMLEHFTTHTQFIVITHNKLTMEAAKYLYGVTMEEEGVSRLVSVQFT